MGNVSQASHDLHHLNILALHLCAQRRDALATPAPYTARHR